MGEIQDDFQKEIKNVLDKKIKNKFWPIFSMLAFTEKKPF